MSSQQHSERSHLSAEAHHAGAALGRLAEDLIGRRWRQLDHPSAT